MFRIINHLPRRKHREGKEIMTEPEKPAKAKVQEQMSLQLARELQEEFVHEDQSIREQIERDAEIVRIHAEEDLRQMINELDRSNVMINKHMVEYEEAENDLTIERRLTQEHKDRIIRMRLSKSCNNGQCRVRERLQLILHLPFVKVPKCDWKMYKDKLKGGIPISELDKNQRTVKKNKGSGGLSYPDLTYTD
ncbi:hypothetical protein Tco_0470750 [Tanacetum coccineum]